MTRKYVDFKVTAWERVEFPDDETYAECVKLIQEGKINSANDVFNEFEGVSCDIIDGTSEQMDVIENLGCATIEIYDVDPKSNVGEIMVWSNEVKDGEFNSL